jgi:hypothetical protein
LVPLPRISFELFSGGTRFAGKFVCFGTGIGKKLVRLTLGIRQMLIGGTLRHHQHANSLLLSSGLTGERATCSIGLHVLLRLLERLIDAAFVLTQPIELLL